MAFLTANFFDPTNDVVIDVSFGGQAWDLSGSRTITWALADGFTENDAWPNQSAAIEQFSRALETYEAFIDVEFSYLGTFDNPTVAGNAGADIVYSVDNSASQEDGFLAYAYYPDRDHPNPSDNPNEGGDIFMNFSEPEISESTFDTGSNGFYVILHELGHAMGLRHPFEENDGRPILAELGSDIMADTDWYTVMSYTDPYERERERWEPATPMVLDIVALQYVYGQNPTAHAGNTIHALEGRDYYYSIWDASGVDTVSAFNENEAWRIVLPELEPTPLVDVRAGFALPEAQMAERLVDSEPRDFVWLLGDIENATGTRFADNMLGNSLDNTLNAGQGNDLIEGGGGDDNLDGQGGMDTAYFEGQIRGYTIQFGPDGTQVIDRRDAGTGADSVSNIELLTFYEGDESADYNLQNFSAPTNLSEDALTSFVELYIAYFNRAPDALGLWFWGTSFANGTSLEAMAALFVNQAETQVTYPESLSNEDFATRVYDNVLGRIPDQKGFEFWVNALNSNAVGRDTFILNVLEGAKAPPDPSLGPDFAAQQLVDRAYLADKTDLGAYFAVHKGMSDVNDAADIMAGFDGSASSLNAAIARVDQAYEEALDPMTGALLLPLVGVLDDPFGGVA